MLLCARFEDREVDHWCIRNTKSPKWGWPEGIGFTHRRNIEASAPGAALLDFLAIPPFSWEVVDVVFRHLLCFIAPFELRGGRWRFPTPALWWHMAELAEFKYFSCQCTMCEVRIWKLLRPLFGCIIGFDVYSLVDDNSLLIQFLFFPLAQLFNTIVLRIGWGGTSPWNTPILKIG